MTGRVVTVGEALGLVRSELDALERAPAASLGIGGAEANVAIGLARLGVSSAWLGRVGDDPFGRRIRRTLLAEGVDTHAIVDAEAPTAVMFKERRPFGRGAVHFLRRGSAGSRVDPADLGSLDIAGADLLHVSGVLAGVSASGAETVRAAVALARRSGTLVSFDVNHRPSLWPAAIAANVYREIAAQSDVVFGGEEELAILVGERADPRHLAAAVAELGPAEVVVKRGDQGAGVLVRGRWLETGAHRVVVADTVGAGDAFVAGYLAAAVAGLGPEDRLERAVLCGAAACEHPGDWEGGPTGQQLASAADPEPVSR